MTECPEQLALRINLDLLSYRSHSCRYIFTFLTLFTATIPLSSRFENTYTAQSRGYQAFVRNISSKTCNLARAMATTTKTLTLRTTMLHKPAVKSLGKIFPP